MNGTAADPLEVTSRQWCALVALLIATGSAGLLFAFLGDFWTDESWYFTGSWLVAQGRLPHFDFFIHHNPLFFYVYGLGQLVSGPSLLVGRLESWAFWLVSVLLLVRLARKLGGGRAAVLCALLIGSNLFSTRYLTTFSWRPLEALLMAAALTVILGDRLRSWRHPLVALMLSLVVALRYPVDLGTVVLGLFLAYVAIRFRKNWRVVWLTFGTAVAVLGLALGPYLLRAPDRFLFGTVVYPLNQVSYARSFGVLGQLGTPFGRIVNALALVGGELRTYLAVATLFATVVVYRALEGRARGTGWFGWCAGRGEWWWLTIVYVVIGELLMVGYGLATPVTHVVPFMLLTLLASVEVAGLASQVEGPEVRRLLWVAVGVVIALVPGVQDGRQLSLRRRWSQSDVFTIRRAAEAVRGLTGAESSVLTFSPAIATEAERRVALDMVMEVWSVFPSWDSARCDRLHLVNMPMLLHAIETRQAGAIVLTRPGRLEDSLGMGAVLAPYRGRIRAALAANYILHESLPGPREGKSQSSSVDVYLPR